MPSLLRPKKHHAKLLDTRDGGFLSRKLLLGLALVVVIVGLPVVQDEQDALV